MMIRIQWRITEKINHVLSLEANLQAARWDVSRTSSKAAGHCQETLSLKCEICERHAHIQWPYLRTGSGVSIVQSISRICSSWMKCCLQACRMLFFSAHPTGPKSYRPLTPGRVWLHGNGALQDKVGETLWREHSVVGFFNSKSWARTSIDGKSLVVEEASLEGVLHLGPVNDVVFGLQWQLLMERRSSFWSRKRKVFT